MKITIYELLGLIKDDKAPKKIRCFGRDYEYSTNDEGIDYIEIDKETGVKYYLSDVIGDNHLGFIFSTTVEILEEEKEIEELKKDVAYIEHPEKDYPNKIERKDYYDRDKMGNKINELVREVNNLKKEGKK